MLPRLLAQPSFLLLHNDCCHLHKWQACWFRSGSFLVVFLLINFPTQASSRSLLVNSHALDLLTAWTSSIYTWKLPIESNLFLDRSLSGFVQNVGSALTFLTSVSFKEWSSPSSPTAGIKILNLSLVILAGSCWSCALIPHTVSICQFL